MEKRKRNRELGSVIKYETSKGINIWREQKNFNGGYQHTAEEICQTSDTIPNNGSNGQQQVVLESTVLPIESNRPKQEYYFLTNTEWEYRTKF